jgi:hypothetical protein
MSLIIDFLIHKFREYDIDMLRNISLSACADQVKFAMAYRDFNINSDYSQQINTSFKISEKHFKKKILVIIIRIPTLKEIPVKILV